MMTVMPFSFDSQVRYGGSLLTPMKPFHVDEQLVSLADKQVALADVTGVQAFEYYEYNRGVPNAYRYEVTFHTPGGKTKLKWLYALVSKQHVKEAAAQSMAVLLDVVRHVCGPRIVANHVATTPELLGYTFSPEGISYKGLLRTTQIVWPQVMGIVAPEPHQLSIAYVDEAGQQQTLGNVGYHELNGMFFSEMLAAYGERLAPRGPAQPMQQQMPMPPQQTQVPPMPQQVQQPGQPLPPQH